MSYGKLLNPVINTNANQGAPWKQKGYSYGRNDSGPFQVWIDEGKDADIDVDAGAFLAGGWTYTVERKGNGISRLEARSGWTGGSTYTTEVLENIWELDSNDADKNLLEADFPNGSIKQPSLATRQQIPNIVNDQSGKWDDASTTFGTGDVDGVTWVFSATVPLPANTPNAIYLPIADYASAKSLSLLMKAGTSAFPIRAPVIKHTQLVSNQYAVAASFSNVGRIVSSGSMTSIEGCPTVLFNVPSNPSPSQFIEMAGDLIYGWKKSDPQVTRLALFKWRILQTWQFGLWPANLFGASV